LKLELKPKREMYYSPGAFDARDLDVLHRISLYEPTGEEVKFIIPQVNRQVLPKFLADSLGYRMNDKHFVLTGKGKFLIDGVKNMPLSTHAAVIEVHRKGKKERYRVSQSVIKIDVPLCNGYTYDGSINLSSRGEWPWKHISTFVPVAKQDVILLIGGLEYLVPTSFFVVWGSEQGLITRDGVLLKKHSSVRGPYLANFEQTEFVPINVTREWVSTKHWIDVLGTSFTAEKFHVLLKSHVFAGTVSQYEETCYPRGEADFALASTIVSRYGRKIAYTQIYLCQADLVKKFKNSWVSHEVVEYVLQMGGNLNFEKLREWVYLSGGWIASSKYYFGPIMLDLHMPEYRVQLPVQKVMFLGGGYGAELKILEELKEYQNNPTREEAGDLAVAFASYVVEHDVTVGMLDRAIAGMKKYFPETMLKMEKRFKDEERHYSPPLPAHDMGQLPISWDPGDGRKYICIEGPQLSDFYMTIGKLAYVFEGIGEVADNPPDLIIEGGQENRKYAWKGVTLVRGLPYEPLRGI